MDVDDFLPMSALQHFSFCRRQCALIHVEGVWEDNVRTVEGTLLHERADLPGAESRPGVRSVRALWLRSERLRLVGRADVVEFAAGGVVRPVEYKRGRRGDWGHDEVQLCAQAMALEEMLGVAVPEGAIFHGASKRRTIVAIDARLRDETRRLSEALRVMVTTRAMPPPVRDARCDDCSLRARCLPEVDLGAGSLRRALEEALR